MARYFGLRGRRLNVASIFLIVMPAIMTFGYSQAVAGGVLDFRSFQEQFPEMDTINTAGDQKRYNSTIQGTVVALYLLGGMFGALTCIFLGDRLGRRRVIFWATITTIIGSILQATSFSFGQFIVARLIFGFGTGGYVATIPVWQSELSRAKRRGAHVVTEGIFVGVGLCLALWFEFGMYYVAGSISWRLPFAFPIVLSFFVLTFIFQLPESPYWLVKRNRVEEAREILSILQDVELHAASVQTEILDMQASLELAGKVSLSSIFKMGEQRVFHRVVLAVLVQMFLQMTGVNSITFYAATIFQTDLHYDTLVSRILPGCYQLMIILGALCCFFTVEGFGRRKLMLFSASGMSICMIILTGVVSNPDNKAALTVAVVILFLYNFIYVIGFFGIPFLYITEVSPPHLRAAVTGIAVGTSWLFNFLVVEITPLAFDNIGYRYFIVYAAINAAIVPTVYFFFPETAGRSLEEIDAIFIKSKSIFDPVRIARSLPKVHLSELIRDEEAKAGVHVSSISHEG